jgi:hypothetical protein
MDFKNLDIQYLPVSCGPDLLTPHCHQPGMTIIIIIIIIVYTLAILVLCLTIRVFQ